MFDFGSILESGTAYAQCHRPGNEYMLEWKPGWLTLATLGVYTRPWMHIDYPRVPSSVGRFEGEAFDAGQWKPEYPNATGQGAPDVACRVNRLTDFVLSRSGELTIVNAAVEAGVAATGGVIRHGRRRSPSTSGVWGTDGRTVGVRRGEP